MSASTKSTSIGIPESEHLKTVVMDVLRFTRYTLRSQIRKPFTVAETLLPEPFAAPLREAGRFSFMMGDAVEQVVEEAVHSLRDKFLSEHEATLTPLEANLFNRLLQSRRGGRQDFVKHYTRYFHYNAGLVLESFGIQNYLLMEGAIHDSYAPLCTWLDESQASYRGSDRIEHIFTCAAACLVELVHAAPLKVVDGTKFDIPILNDRGLQTYANQLVFGYLCYLTALGNLPLDTQERNRPFLQEAARNDVIGEFTGLISAICLPDPQQAVADFFLRRFRMSPIGTSPKSQRRYRQVCL